MDKLISFLNKLLDFIYKKKCYFCGSNKECVKMCSKCYSELIHSDLTPDRELDGITVYSAGAYEKYIQKMIRGLKYHNQKDLAFYMAKFMWEYFSEIQTKYNLPQQFQVVPVPLHIKREKKRGYNHMQLVAEEFCALSGFTPNYELIKRIKNTKPQYKLSRTEKIRNLENAFKADITKLQDMPVLIIDDICTSGATFDSMIKELKKNNIQNITCLSTSSPN